MSLITPRSAPPPQVLPYNSPARVHRGASSSNGGRGTDRLVPVPSRTEHAYGSLYRADAISGADGMRPFLRPHPPAGDSGEPFVAPIANASPNGNGRHLARWEATGGAPGKLNLEAYWQPGHHRSGWRYALDSLRSLHSPRGVLFDGFVEKKFAWGADPGERNNGWTPYSRAWIGVIHNPPEIPDWFNMNGQSPVDILRTQYWQQSMSCCCGIFTLSNYLKIWLEKRVPVPVCSLFHPTEIPDKQFSMDKYRRNTEKKIVQIGWWLRRFQSLYRLRVKGFGKLLLDLGQHWIDNIRNVELTTVEERDLGSVELSPYLDNEQYDELLSKNLVFLHLYDSSANNALIECIARATPVLINPLPAVVEYLGPDYPFYFQTLAEAAGKAEDGNLVLAAHQYLREESLREKLTGAYFQRSLVDSEIYQQLPEPKSTYWHSPNGR
jgi:hypothetical protein